MIEVIGGAEGDRTPGLRIANAALCQTELLPHGGEEYRFRFQVSSFRFKNEPGTFADERGQSISHRFTQMNTD